MSESYYAETFFNGGSEFELKMIKRREYICHQVCVRIIGCSMGWQPRNCTKLIDTENSRIQTIDITRAAALLDANVENRQF